METDESLVSSDMNPLMVTIKTSNATVQTEVDGFFDLNAHTELEEMKIQYAETVMCH